MDDKKVLWKDRKRTLFGLPLSFTKYTLTSDKLLIERGFFNLKEDEVRLYRIMDLSLKRTFGQRLFGVGSIHCCSADKTMGDFDIVNIKDPKRVKELLSDAIEKERIAKRVFNREDMIHDSGEHEHTDTLADFNSDGSDD